MFQSPEGGRRGLQPFGYTATGEIRQVSVPRRGQAGPATAVDSGFAPFGYSFSPPKGAGGACNKYIAGQTEDHTVFQSPEGGRRGLQLSLLLLILDVSSCFSPPKGAGGACNMSASTLRISVFRFSPPKGAGGACTVSAAEMGDKWA